MKAQAQPDSHIDDAATEDSTQLSHARLAAYPTSGTRAGRPLLEDQNEEGGERTRAKEEEVEEEEDDRSEFGEVEELEDNTEMGAASWAGTPTIRGSSESMRMALLTVSLVGLQYVRMLHREAEADMGL